MESTKDKREDIEKIPSHGVEGYCRPMIPRTLTAGFRITGLHRFPGSRHFCSGGAYGHKVNKKCTHARQSHRRSH